MVTVPSGQTSATFSVTTVPVTIQKVATIKATYKSAVQTQSLTVMPPGLVSVGFIPISVVGGTPSVGTVTISGPAPTGGLLVKLKCDSTQATVPASVSVPAGKMTATFTAKTTPVKATVTATVTATQGITVEEATLTITPSTLSLVSVYPIIVIGPESSVGTAYLSGPAPSGGYVVSLSSNQESVTVPAKVTIPSGSDHATFAVKTETVAVQTIAAVSASLNGITQTTNLTVNPPSITGLSLNPSTVVGGKNSTGTVVLGGPAPSGGITVTLTSNSSFAVVAASVTIPGGKTSATFVVETSAVSAKTSVTITANLAPNSKTAALTITQ